jgi:GT2 family glycosyltransferase
VVIPTYRRPDRLSGVVDALGAQTLDPHRFEVIVIDNASGDGTWDSLQELAAAAPFTVRLLQTVTNHGPAPARNLGWQAARAPVVAFLDDDCLPEAGWLAAGLDTMEANERLGVVQGRVRAPDDFSFDGLGDWYHWQIIDGQSPYFEACNIFYRSAALAETGGFDESIGWWGEDAALGWSVVEAGWARDFAPGAVVVHAVQHRGWRWHFGVGLLERNVVGVAAHHPGYRRDAFWRPWAIRREDAGLVLALIGLLGALLFRPALVLLVPYAWWRRPRWGRPGALRLVGQCVLVDTARTAGQLRGALEHRVLVI